MVGGEITLGDIAGYVRDVTFAGALVFILYGGWKKVWVWGDQLTQEQKRNEKDMVEEKARTAKAERDAEYWRNFSFSLLTPVEAISKRLPPTVSLLPHQEE